MSKQLEGLRHKWALARADAHARGQKFYDGKPCVTHGITQRYTSNHCCELCRKEFRKKRKTEKVLSPKGDPIFEKLRREKPHWPAMEFENAHPGYNDTIGSYKTAYIPPTRTGCSASDTAEA